MATDQQQEFEATKRIDEQKRRGAGFSASLGREAGRRDKDSVGEAAAKGTEKAIDLGTLDVAPMTLDLDTGGNTDQAGLADKLAEGIDPAIAHVAGNSHPLKTDEGQQVACEQLEGTG
jgi:hypothetical protein